MLKQPQYQPLPVEQQVVIVFAGTNGFLDEIAVAEVRALEEELLPLHGETRFGLAAVDDQRARRPSTTS